MIYSESPEGRGSIERSFRTFQDRLVEELKIHGIREKGEAERYLREVFISSYQRLFGREPKEEEPAWRKALENLREILSRRERRKIRQNLTIVFEGRIFQLNPLGLRERLSGRWVEVRELF
ncbi:MAG: hypothetical protein QXS69_03305, partial [Candidatus Aenigmatarchaeota archaeon]